MKDLFLCHTGADKPWVESLAERLEGELIDGRPIRVFLDKWDIHLGENLLSRIEEGLRSSRYLAVVLSPALTQADWPTLEWQTQVYADPSGKLARILPLLRHKYDPDSGNAIDIPLPLRVLRYLDFTKESLFEESFQTLLRKLRGQRPMRGRTDPVLGSPALSVGRAAPEDHDEVVLSNLLGVHRYPMNLWSDETTATKKSDVWKMYEGSSVAPFALYANRLYSFVPPQHPKNPFRRFLTGRSPRSDRPIDWLDDRDRSRVLIGLLNAALREHCYHLGIRAVKDEWPPRFYCPILAQSRVFRWARQARLRTLAKMATRPTGETFGVHYAARMRVTQLGRDLFVLIEPGWLFTKDGVIPLTGTIVTRLSTAWGGKERNAAVLRNVLMWSVLLAQGRPEIRIDIAGDQQLVLKTVPSYTELRVGLPRDAIRLDHMLAGGGGEWAEEADSELDTVAAMEMVGALDDTEEARGDGPTLPESGIEDEIPDASETDRITEGGDQ